MRRLAALAATFLAIFVMFIVLLFAAPSTSGEAGPPAQASDFVAPGNTPTGSGPPNPTFTPTSSPTSTQGLVLPPTITASSTPLDLSLGEPSPTLPSFTVLTPTPIWDPYEDPFDLTGPIPTPTLPGFLNPADTPDLEVWALEVTQGMQSLDNDMPLVADRLTFLRVYVRTDGLDYPDVKVRVLGHRAGQDMGTISADNQPIIAHGDGGDRTDVDDSLYLQLPASWTEDGSILLQVFVYAGIPSSAFDNEPASVNNFRQTSVSFEQAIPARLSFIPIHLHEDFDEGQPEKLYTTSEPSFWSIVIGMLRHLPYAAFELYAPPVDQVHCYFGSFYEQLFIYDSFEEHGDCAFNLQSPGGAQYVTYVMDWMDTFTAEPPAGVNLYGMIHPDFGIDFYTDEGDILTFDGYALNNQAVGRMDPGFETVNWRIGGAGTLAHELGHRLGLGHADCAGIEEAGGGLDDSFPWTAPDCSIAIPGEDGFMGFDAYYELLPGVNEPTVIDNDPGASAPNQGFPLMGYMKPQYMDAYHWCRVLLAIGVDCDPQVHPFLAGRPPLDWASRDNPGHAALDLLSFDPAGQHDHDPPHGPVLLVSGMVQIEPTQAMLDQVMALPEMPGAIEPHQHLNERETGFEIVALDADGQVLASRPVVDSTVNHAPLNLIYFFEELPWVEGSAAVEIRLQGEPVAARSFSPNPPEVQLLAPNGGEVFDSPFEVLWTGADADGDELTYTLQFSADGGETWQVLAIGQHEQRFRVLSLINLAGTDQGKIRVIASDGANTAIDESDGVFSLPNTPPLPAIQSPGHLAVFPQQARVLLRGSATDREDGLLPPQALRWESDVDGFLGGGDRLEFDDLTAGRHLLTLSAEDSDGAVNQAQVEIMIDPDNRRNLPDDSEIELANRILAAGPEWQPDGSRLPLTQVVILALFAAGGVVALALFLPLVRSWIRR